MNRLLALGVTLALAAGAARAEAVSGADHHAWQNWAVGCQGCHRPDASGSPKGAPPMKGVVARFLWVEGGRDYLMRVPGVATSPLGDADLAELLNFVLRHFDGEDLPRDFKPFTAEEI
jgi:mono/diheme cytochrome c family protein